MSWGFWGGCPPTLLPQAFSQPLEEVVNLQSQLWQSFQVEIQKSLFIFFRYWTPPGRVIFKVRVMAILQLHWVVPPVLSLRFLSVVILASGVGMGLRLALADGTAQLLCLFLQCSHGCQGPLVGFPHLGKAPFSRGALLPFWGFCSSEAICQLDQVPPSSMVVNPPSTPGGLLGRTPPLQ